jgi:TIR domain
MPFVTLLEAREAASQAVAASQMTVEAQLRVASDAPLGQFDIFLSHSSMDKELVLGVMRILENKGFSVYVDWADPRLNRPVTKATAAILRRRMRNSSSLFYVHTSNASLSKWCPWELGFFDALSNTFERVYVMPLVESSKSHFSRQEYLGLYRQVEVVEPLKANGRKDDVTYS